MLPLLAVALLALLKPAVVPWWYERVVLAVLIAGAFSVVAGWKLSAPARRVQEAQWEETERALLQPLTSLLLPGSTFSRQTEFLPKYHPSLLLSRIRDAVLPHTRIEGRLLGLPAGMDVVRATSEDDIPSCLFARVELPFAVAGHLRIRHGKARFILETVEDALVPSFREEGFEPLEPERTRLGRGFRCDWAPAGTDATAPDAPTPADALPPRAVLTDRLLEFLGTNDDVMFAVVGRSLWVIVTRQLEVFERRLPTTDDLALWQKAASAVADVELLTREVLAAGAIRR
ncbi:MAG: hypothetical protein ABW221_23425 [Vicinamibacteria bacterium]